MAEYNGVTKSLIQFLADWAFADPGAFYFCFLLLYMAKLDVEAYFLLTESVLSYTTFCSE